MNEEKRIVKKRNQLPNHVCYQNLSNLHESTVMMMVMMIRILNVCGLAKHKSLYTDRRHAFEHGIIRNVLSFGRLIKTQAHHVQKCIDCCPNRQKHPSFAS